MIDPVSIVGLALAVVLAIERMFKHMKRCRSGCCEIDLMGRQSTTEMQQPRPAPPDDKI